MQAPVQPVPQGQRAQPALREQREPQAPQERMALTQTQLSR